MTQDKTVAKNSWPSGIIGFFDGRILAMYQNQSDKYELRTDYFEGSLTIRNDYYDRLSETERDSTYLNVQFGFRRCKNGELAIVVWLPDLKERCPEPERKKWLACHLEDGVFPHEPDPRFELWIRRYIHGDWDVENPILQQISAEVASINAITEVMLGKPLYLVCENSALIFPMAENDHRYQDAHREAYAYLIDNLQKPAIKAIGDRLGIADELVNTKTLAALKRILPRDLHNPILIPLDIVSEQRRLACHKVRPTALPFPAFEQFSKDMDGVVAALRALRNFLQEVFGVTAERCQTRQSSLAALPKIDDTNKPQPNYSICGLPKVVGKTIQSVEFGFREPNRQLHESEAMILHFTDGSMLGIATGSNAQNVVVKCECLEPSDFHVDFMLTFVPPIA